MTGGNPIIKAPTTPEVAMNETPEQKLQREQKEFNDDLKQLTDFLAKPENTTPEKEQQLRSLLDTDFYDNISKLDCEKIKEIDKNITALLASKTISLDAGEKGVLNDFHILITPYTLDGIGSSKFEEVHAYEQITTGGKTIVTYNTLTNGGTSFLTGAKTEVNKPEYSTLLGKQKILEALNTPTEENIVSLQNFLSVNLDPTTKFPGTDVSAVEQLKKTSFERRQKWDGAFGPGTQGALIAYLNEFNAFQRQRKEEANTIANSRNAAETLAKSNTQTVINIEDKGDTDAETLLKNSKVMYENPERTNILPIPSPDLLSVTYRGATYYPTVQQQTASYGMSGRGYADVLNPTEWFNTIKNTKEFIDWKTNLDKEIDFKIVRYDSKLNMYLYKGMGISREDIGTGPDKMTLEQFQIEVDKTYISNNNNQRTTETRISPDERTIQTIKDFRKGKGYQIETVTVDADGNELSRTTETNRNGKQNITTTNSTPDKENPQDGEILTNQSLTRTRGNVTVTKNQEFEDGIFVTKGTRTRTNENTGRTSTVTVDNTGVNVGPGSDSRDIIDLFKPETYVNNFGKTVEDKNSFRAKAEYLPFAITPSADTINLEPVTADYIGKALNTQQIEKTGRTTSINAGTNNIQIPEVTDKNSLTANYTIVQKGNKIDISLKKEGTPLSQKTFDAEMKRILEIAGVANIQMFNFASKGKKDTPTSDINITDYSFTVGSESKKIKQIATNESASVPTADPEQNESLPEAVKNAFTLLGTRKQEGITNTITLHAPDTKISNIQQGHIDIIENNGYTVRYLSNKSDGIITTLEVTPKLVPMQSITKDQIPVSLEKINSMKHAFHIAQQATEEILSPEKIDQLKDLESQGIIPSALTEDILRHYDLNEKNYPNYIPLDETHPQTVNYPGTNVAYSDVYEYLYGKLKTEREGHGIEFSYPRSPSEKVSGTIGFVGGVFEIEQTNGTTLTFQNVYELNKDYFIVRSNNAKYKISKGTTNEQGVYMASMEAYTDNDAQIEQVAKL